MPDIDIGQISEALNDKADRDLNNTQPLADYVIESKYPTAQDPTWYRLYKSGWLEQGGVFSTSISNSTTSFSLVKNFVDGNWFFYGHPQYSANSNVYMSDFRVYDKTISGATIYIADNHGTLPRIFDWEAKGMSAQEQS